MCVCVVRGNVHSLLLRLDLVLFCMILANLSVAGVCVYTPHKHTTYKYINYVYSDIEDVKMLIEFILNAYMYTYHTFLLPHVVYKKIN